MPAAAPYCFASAASQQQASTPQAAQPRFQPPEVPAALESAKQLQLGVPLLAEAPHLLEGVLGSISAAAGAVLQAQVSLRALARHAAASNCSGMLLCISLPKEGIILARRALMLHSGWLGVCLDACWQGMLLPARKVQAHRPNKFVHVNGAAVCRNKTMLAEQSLPVA